ncbi:MAG: S26 family signal peptidase [Betaproteobacteria bacterium]|nr:S26 family signal peptidase [Betaproteobacteria bacterium]
MASIFAPSNWRVAEWPDRAGKWMAANKAFVSKAKIWVLLWLLGMAVATVWGHQNRFFWNRSYSLPGWVYYASPELPVVKGGFVAFQPPKTPLVRAHFGSLDVVFVKQVLGVAGDVVSRDPNGVVSINGVVVGKVKKRSMMDEALVPGPLGVIPDRCIYAGSGHRDGFDSRYAAIGFICSDRIFGGAREVL